MRPYTIVLALLASGSASAQQHTDSLRRPAAPPDCSRPTYGVSTNAPCVVGVRATLRNRGERRVTGLDLTAVQGPFEADTTSRSSVHGVALGLTGPSAGELTGINVGLLHAYGARSLRGVSFGALGAGSERETQGLTVGGLVAGGGNVTGVTVGGLAVAGDRIRGVQAGGIGVFGDDIAGLSFGTGVSAARIRGVTGAAYMVHARAGGLSGISASLVGVMSEGSIRGVTGAGVAVIGRRDAAGVTAAVGGVQVQELNGVAAGAITRVFGTQRGLTVGLVNRAQRLRGVQIGLLNEARNNPRLLRWLPGLNVHF